MSRLGLHRMPWIVLVGTWLTLFQTWVLFAELVIDRYGLWRLLPGYRKSDVCVYDPVVAVAITLGLYLLARRDRSRSTSQAGEV